MKEIEAKFFVLDLEKIRMRLQELEARLIQERVLEMNIRFDLPDSGLGSKGQVLRLRQDTEARLTYKGAGTNEQGVLNRTEIEFTVEDFEKAKNFLEALGYQSFFYYEKYRTTYDIPQASEVSPLFGASEASTHIMLDELPYGNFVEIEGESSEAIRAVAEKLNLQWDTAIPISYHLLFKRLCLIHPDLDPATLSFAALNGLNITVAELSIHAADE